MGNSPFSGGGGAWPDDSGRQVTTYKTITFTGASGLGEVSVAVPIFTLGGPNALYNGVIVERIGGVCTVLLTETGGTATLALGVTGNTSLFVGATTATTIDAGEVWVSTTPTAGGLAMPAGTQATLISASIIGTIATGGIDSGTIAFFVTWRPANAGAYLKAA